MSNPVDALKTWLTSALPTEAELIESFEAGMRVWDEILGENDDDV